MHNNKKTISSVYFKCVASQVYAPACACHQEIFKEPRLASGPDLYVLDSVGLGTANQGASHAHPVTWQLPIGCRYD